MFIQLYFKTNGGLHLVFNLQSTYSTEVEGLYFLQYLNGRASKCLAKECIGHQFANADWLVPVTECL